MGVRVVHSFELQGGNAGMEKRNLRMVKTGPPAIGVCDACNAVFKSHLHQTAQSEWEIRVQFERHKCKPQHVDQAAIRIATATIVNK